jgi:hypothetical protein
MLLYAHFIQSGELFQTIRVLTHVEGVSAWTELRHLQRVVVCPGLSGERPLIMQAPTFRCQLLVQVSLQPCDLVINVLDLTLKSLRVLLYVVSRELRRIKRLSFSCHLSL